jgi:hypothetical protein
VNNYTSTDVAAKAGSDCLVAVLERVSYVGRHCDSLDKRSQEYARETHSCMSAA